LHVVTDDAETSREHISKTLRESGVMVKGIEKIPPSLEDVFVTLIEVS